MNIIEKENKNFRANMSAEIVQMIYTKKNYIYYTQRMKNYSKCLQFLS